MLDINKYFTYSKNIHDANYYTFEFFEEFKKLYNELKNKYKHIHIDLRGKNDISTEHDSEVYFIKIMKLLLTIYIYFIEWNNNDPYILIKLNKLIFGRVANIGIPEIDEDIENTLTFRDIIPYHLNDYREPNIVDIYRGVCNFLEGTDDTADTKRNDNGTYIFKDSTFVLNKFQEAFGEVRRSKLDGPEYSLNLYLAFEMGLNIFIILIILILLKIMSNGDDSEFNKNITFTQTLATWIVAQIAISIFGIINVLRFVQ